MLWFLLSLLAMTAASPQSPVTIDPGTLISIFGMPSTPSPSASTTPSFSASTTQQQLEDITRGPTPATFVDKATGEQCKCVPYYLCNNELIGIDANNASVTGYGELDIRFGEEDDCQESVERCCVSPKEDTDVVPPEPSPDNLKGCGYRNPKGLDFSIKGGNGLEAQFGEFPWVVALLEAADDSYIGVAALIHPQVLVTGAHVIAKYSPGQIKARAGEWDTQTTKERLPYQERAVDDMILHKEFHNKSLRNDMALLHLQSPMQLTDHINVICLPSQGESFEQATNCVANGWGKTSFGAAGRYAVILKRVEVDMVPHGSCGDRLRRTRLGNHFKLHESFVCAGGEPGMDTCKGDGGAPLVCPMGGERYKLAGMVAWGIGCGDAVPAVYVNVPRFRTWIDQGLAKWGVEVM